MGHTSTPLQFMTTPQFILLIGTSTRLHAHMHFTFLFYTFCPHIFKRLTRLVCAWVNIHTHPFLPHHPLCRLDLQWDSLLILGHPSTYLPSLLICWDTMPSFSHSLPFTWQKIETWGPRQGLYLALPSPSQASSNLHPCLPTYVYTPLTHTHVGTAATTKNNDRRTEHGGLDGVTTPTV